MDKLVSRTSIFSATIDLDARGKYFGQIQIPYSRDDAGLGNLLHALAPLFLMWMGAKDVWKKLSETPRQKRERERLAAWNKQLEDRLTQIKERYPERDDYDSNGIPYGP